MDPIETPKAPERLLRTKLFHSVITILWWVGIWGLSETVLILLFKNSVTTRLAIYAGMILFVFLMIFISPDIVENF